MKKHWVLLLILGAWVTCVSSTASGTKYYVDCNYGSNGNAGNSPEAAWRTPLEITLHSAGGVFQAGDSIYLKRDCTWYEGFSLSSSGASGKSIYVDSFNRDGSASGPTNEGTPPHLTGYLPIGDAYWSVYAGNVWVSKPLFDADPISGSDDCANDGGHCVACPTQGILYSCLSQPLDAMSFVRFGTVWGNAAASVAAMAKDRDWFFDPTAQLLYVYCGECSTSEAPPDFYGQVAPIVSPTTMLNLSSVQYVEVQHLLMDWYTGYGVQVQGASDHLWLANLAANSLVENGTHPLGFYVQPSAAATDIHLYNTDANMNYAGYRFEGTTADGVVVCPAGACAFEIKNCRAYANRAYGVVDDVQGAVSYDYCHLYGNNIATALTLDTSPVLMPGAGPNNVLAETAPWVREWRRWPAYTTVTYDDPGLVRYSDTYISGLLPMMASRQIPLSIAVVTGGDTSQSIIGEVQGWINAGWDVNTHSVSHEYWDPPAANCGDDPSLPSRYAVSATTIPCHAVTGLQYTGTVASTVGLYISHTGGTFEGVRCPTNNCMILAPQPYDGCAYHVWDLTPVAPGGTAGANQINALGMVASSLSQSCFSAAALDSLAKGSAHAYALADVNIADIKAAPVSLDFDENLLEGDEMGWAQSWMNANFTGLPTKRVYVMPGSYEDTVTEGIAAGLGFVGVRGSGSLRPCCGANTTLANGYDVFNVLSQGAVPSYQGMTYVGLRNRISQDLFKNALWGRPIGYFWHVNELRPDEVENFMDALVQGGASLKSNTQMVNFLLGCKTGTTPSGYVAGSYYVCPSLELGAEADFRPTVNSPVVDAGAILDARFQYDLMGVNQTLFGTKWEIGAYAYVPESVGAR